MHPTELLCDVGHVESRFGPFGDSVSFRARYVHGFRQNVPQAQKSFWMHRMALLGVRLKWKLVSVYLEIVLILIQDRCTVCAKRTVGSEIILGAPDGTTR
jgi:hypothetical protein